MLHTCSSAGMWGVLVCGGEGVSADTWGVSADMWDVSADMWGCECWYVGVWVLVCGV